jgi:hypothetical protein
LFRPFTFSLPPVQTIEAPPITDGGFVQIAQFSRQIMRPVSIAPARFASVAVQFASEPVETPHLSHQPPVEIFGLFHEVLRPEEDVVLNPSPEPPKYEPEGPQLPAQVITADGELVDVPPLPEIDATTHPAVVELVTKKVVDQTLVKAEQLRLVVSEMQAIENEKDPQKRLQLEETLGITLDVQKDSLVSEMKENVTQLEQLMNQTTPKVAQLSIQASIGEESFSPKLPPKPALLLQSDGLISIAPSRDSLEPVSGVAYADQSVQSQRIGVQLSELQSFTETASAESESVPETPPGQVVSESPFVLVQSGSRLADSPLIVVESPLELIESPQISRTGTQSNLRPVTLGIEPSSSFHVHLASEQTREQPLALVAPVQSQGEISQPKQRQLHIQSSTSFHAATRQVRPSLSAAQSLEVKAHPLSRNAATLVLASLAPAKPDMPVVEALVMCEQAVQSSVGPPSLSDVDAFSRAVQEPSLTFSQMDSIEEVNTITAQPLTIEADIATATIPPRVVVDCATEPAPEFAALYAGILTDSASGGGSQHLPSPASSQGGFLRPVVSAAFTHPSPRSAQSGSGHPLAVSPPAASVGDTDVQLAPSDSQDGADGTAPQNKSSPRPVIELSMAAQDVFSVAPKPVSPPRKASNPPAARQRMAPMPVAAVTRRATRAVSAVAAFEVMPTLKTQLDAIEGASGSASVLQAIQTLSTTLSSLPQPAAPAVAIGAAPSPETAAAAPPESVTSIAQALITAAGLAQRFMDQAETQAVTASGVADQLATSAESFLKAMQEPAGAGTSEQSEFLREVNTLTRTLSQVGSAPDDHLLKLALAEARAALEREQEHVAALEREVIALKSTVDVPQISTRMAQLATDLEALAAGKPACLIPDPRNATTLVPLLLKTIAQDNLVNKAGAAPHVQAAIVACPNWSRAAGELWKAIDLVQGDYRARRRDDLIKQLTDKIELLQREIDRLHTGNTLTSHDTNSAWKLAEKKVEQLQKALDLANEHIAVLERQLRQADKSSELDLARRSERDRLAELTAEKKRVAELEAALASANDKLAAANRRFEEMFAQAADTQTANQVLESRTGEMLMRAHIDAERGRALEQMHGETAAELARTTTKMADMVAEREARERRIAELEGKLEDMKRQHLDADVAKVLEKDGVAEVPRLIRLYQQRVAMYQDLLDRRIRELIDLRAKRAMDQKMMILMQRDIQRLKNELKMALLRYECAKGEVAVCQKSIANRDETIRQLKREIDRLRNLLKIAGPIQQHLRSMQKDENDMYEEIKKTQVEIERVQRTRARFPPDSSAATYFDQMLVRRQNVLAKLEMKRRAFKEQQELNAIEKMRAVSHLVTRQELEIPESLVIQMMPRPPPVRNLPRRTQVEDFEDVPMIQLPDPPVSKFQTSSYADTLQVLGSLAGKKSPKTLHDMLRNARHSKVVVPEAYRAPNRLVPTALDLAVRPAKLRGP